MCWMLLFTVRQEMAAQTDREAVDGSVSTRCDPEETAPPSTNNVINNHCIKQPIRKIKPIPPPLDLSQRGPLDLTSSESVNEFASLSASYSPRSPLSSNQKHLPFRKRLQQQFIYKNEMFNPYFNCLL